MKLLAKYLILFFLFLVPDVLPAQKVALVLSGGGAKAFSHIGVLRSLEENEIPIDYIVGNSMGALIGALYSSGYSPDEIEAMLTNSSFLKFTKENISKSACYYQKNEENASIARFTFNVEKGFNIQIPLNVYDFKEIDYQMMIYFASASCLSQSSFDNLMIPFRCVATDIDSSRMVVFRDGNLAKAVRASVTFPFFVRPIDIDGVVYFDGGMYDNFPVDVAISEFNPDIIIGSKAVSNYESPNPENAITLIQSMLMTKADFKIDSTLGVLIESNTGQGSIFQFSNTASYIDSGYIAANRMIEKIADRLDNNQRFKVDVLREKFRNTLPDTKLTDINIVGLAEKQKKYFKTLIGDIERFKDLDGFYNFYNCLVYNENISDIYPETEYDSLEQSFNMNLNMRKAAAFKLNVGGYISSSGVNEGYIDFGYNYFGKVPKNIDVGAYFGTYYNSIFATGRIEFPARLPVTLKIKGLMSRRNYFSNARYFLGDKFPAYIITDENYLDFSVGIPAGANGVTSIGYTNINSHYQYYQDNYFTRTDTADLSDFYFLSPWIEFRINTHNRKLYPTSGYSIITAISYYTGIEKFTRGSGKSPTQEVRTNLDYFSMVFKYLTYTEISRKISMGVSAEIGYSTKPLLSNLVSSLLFATPYEPLPVMKTMFLENYRSNNYGGAGLIIDYNFVKNFNLRFDGYYYQPYEKISEDPGSGQVYLAAPFSHNYLAGSARLVYHPPIGVISISANYIEKPGSKFGFLVNLGYLIFNRSKLNK